MKKIVYLVCFVFLIGYSYAEFPRKVLIEEYTTANNCPNCLTAKPQFQSIIDGNSSIIPVIFHTNLNVDKLANPLFWGRYIYYQDEIPVPAYFVNGQLSDVIGKVANAANQYKGKTSPFQVSVIEDRSSGKDMIEASVHIIAEEVPDIQSEVFVAILERHINDASVGNQGETDFYYVLRYMRPGQIFGFPAEITAPGVYGYRTDFGIQNTWDYDELYIVAWLQDRVTGEVLNAGITANYSNEDPIAAASASSVVFTTENHHDPQRIYLQNLSRVDLHLTEAIKIEGDDVFTISAQPLTEIFPGMKLPIVVTMNATEAGEYSATITIKTDDPENPEIVIPVNGSADGTAANPEISLNTSGIEFGEVSTVAVRDVIISNTGEGPMTIESIELSDDNDGQFELADTDVAEISTGGSHTIKVYFKPKTEESFFTDLTIKSNAKNTQELSIPVTGTGVAVKEFAQIEITSDDIVFDNTATTSNYSLEVKNSGNKKLKLNTIAILDDADQVFKIVSSPVTSLDPEAVHTFKFQFSPKENKSYSAKFKLTSDSETNNNITLDMTGTGEGIITDPGSVRNQELISKYEVSVLPNPSKDIFNVKLVSAEDCMGSIKLYDMQGKMSLNIFSGNIAAGQFSADAAAGGLAKGSYRLLINLGGQTISYPVVLN